MTADTDLTQAFRDVCDSFVPRDLIESSFGQLSIECDGARESVCFGENVDGSVVALNDSYPVYCAGRLPLNLVLSLLLHEQRIGWNVPIEQMLPAYAGSWVGSLSISDVALHSSGLDEVSGILARLVDRESLVAAIASLPRREIDPGGNVSIAYSDYAVGHILGELVEAVTGHDYRLAVIEGTGRTAPNPGAAFSGLYPFVDLRTDVPRAALGDISPANTRRWNPSFGWFNSAMGLTADASEALVRVKQVDDLFARVCEVRASSPWDNNLERPLNLCLAGCASMFESGFIGLSGQGGISFCGFDDSSRIVSWTVSPALPTSSALARSRRILEIADGFLRSPSGPSLK